MTIWRGTNQIHRAILALMDPTNFEDFLQNLRGDIAEIMRLETVTLVLETVQDGKNPAVKRMGEARIKYSRSISEV